VSVDLSSQSYFWGATMLACLLLLCVSDYSVSYARVHGLYPTIVKLAYSLRAFVVEAINISYRAFNAVKDPADHAYTC
jgi:hypothetical protein